MYIHCTLHSTQVLRKLDTIICHICVLNINITWLVVYNVQFYDYDIKILLLYYLIKNYSIQITYYLYAGRNLANLDTFLENKNLY